MYHVEITFSAGARVLKQFYSNYTSSGKGQLAIVHQEEDKIHSGSGTMEYFENYGGFGTNPGGEVGTLPTTCLGMPLGDKSRSTEYESMSRRMVKTKNKKVHHLDNWKEVILSKAQGGLGFRNLKIHSKALKFSIHLILPLLKRANKKSLSSKVIKAKYEVEDSWMTKPVNSKPGVSLRRSIRVLWPANSGADVRYGCGSKDRILHDLIFKIRGYESMYGYGITDQLWKIINLRGRAWTMPSKITEALFSWEIAKAGVVDRNRWRMVLACIWWTIWKQRNSRCFENSNHTGRSQISIYSASDFQAVLRCIRIASRFTKKGFIYFGGVAQKERDRIVHMIGIPAGNIVARIRSWTSKNLSYAGIAQLVQSGKNTAGVLFGLELTRSSKKGLVTWDKVCKPRVFGGLNITNIMLWNKDALAKNCWDLAHKIDKLWIKWIHEFYLKGQLIDNVRVPQ
ncbi:hypothetical protein H5410_023684 [Solanum commersonii]|uniref:Uncharacterized protein n=1 Tax=Solanum commersonii TaxID=4109 RepID=A0A9J5ZHK1_SOLCO|nr:hypothetical protein H5410_023684 [Solanum commersonii]